MIETMFTYPLVLLLLLLIPLFALFFLWRGLVRRAALRQLGEQELVQKLLQQISATRRRLKAFFWLLALAALIVALARPVWGMETQIVRRQGSQVLVALDVSRSMNAQDITPSRLRRARLDSQELFNALRGNDFGLIIFAQSAYTYMPLTYDVRAAEVFLEGVSTDMLTVQGTNIAAAIQTALRAFEQRLDTRKILILMTDGETHEEDPIAVAELAAEQGVTIHTVAYGTEEGAPIPLYDESGNLIDYQTDSAGRMVQASVNTDILERIARIGGGVFVRGGGDMSALVNAVQQSGSGTTAQTVTRPIERFGIPVLIALIALSIEMLLPETRSEKSA